MPSVSLMETLNQTQAVSPWELQLSQPPGGDLLSPDGKAAQPPPQRRGAADPSPSVQTADLPRTPSRCERMEPRPVPCSGPWKSQRGRPLGCPHRPDLGASGRRPERRLRRVEDSAFHRDAVVPRAGSLPRSLRQRPAGPAFLGGQGHPVRPSSPRGSPGVARQVPQLWSVSPGRPRRVNQS